ncbi:hypothetical protein AVEN_222373-1 [Araneus ventricosus]|uniref:Uncharacterized protein n=1 Tax=Araneus ventricosus TaxID=182803 RepID=A0A4Y2EHD9_ARAVE|nr:hypothetical protein AVEN_222373-1 [Araneus ventricosus]
MGRGWRAPSSKPNSTKDPSCVRARRTLNPTKWAKFGPPAGVAWKLGVDGSSSKKKNSLIVSSVELRKLAVSIEPPIFLNTIKDEKIFFDSQIHTSTQDMNLSLTFYALYQFFFFHCSPHMRYETR